MSEAIIREIAEQIIREQLLQNWIFYLVLLALLLVSSIASAFMASYIRKRAETYATKADLAELLTQLRATTEAAEQVKTAIAHTDWTTKEWKTLRRVKLEELVGTVYALRVWLDKEMNIRFFEKNAESEVCPVWKLELISNLYFAELNIEIRTLILVHWRYDAWMFDVKRRLLAAGNNLGERQAIFDSVSSEMEPHREHLIAAIAAIEAKAPAVMKEIVGV
ncbi:MAG: hypothetical protein ACREBC_14365 [Pyrinomonadaceae bacterium]